MKKGVVQLKKAIRTFLRIPEIGVNKDAGYRDQISNNTRFFRNYPQLLAITKTVRSIWKRGSQLDVIHIGGSIGCEAISFVIVMKEIDSSYELNVLTVDMDKDSLDYGRRLAYDEKWFTPILGEGGGQGSLRDKWFAVHETKGKRKYTPHDSLTRTLKFDWLDITKPDRELSADIVFCQNVLIHMEPNIAALSLRNTINLLHYPSILVCAGMDLDLKEIIVQAGLRPVPDSVREIHESWSSHRFHYQKNRGKYYFELEDMDMTREDWISRYSSIFVKV